MNGFGEGCEVTEPLYQIVEPGSHRALMIALRDTLSQKKRDLSRFFLTVEHDVSRPDDQPIHPLYPIDISSDFWGVAEDAIRHPQLPESHGRLNHVRSRACSLATFVRRGGRGRMVGQRCPVFHPTKWTAPARDCAA